MKSFYTFNNFPIPSLWKAADGGNYGYIAIDKNEKTENIIAVQTINGEKTERTAEIDYYKIQYRYYQVNEEGKEVLDEEEENLSVVGNPA